MQSVKSLGTSFPCKLSPPSIFFFPLLPFFFPLLSIFLLPPFSHSFFFPFPSSFIPPPFFFSLLSYSSFPSSPFPSPLFLFPLLFCSLSFLFPPFLFLLHARSATYLQYVCYKHIPSILISTIATYIPVHLEPSPTYPLASEQ